MLPGHEVIRCFGFALPRSEIATSAERAAGVAAGIGFPVCLKVASAEILHKTDVGGVEFDLSSKAKVRKAFSRLLGRVKEKAPGAKIDGVLVEEMCPPGVDLFIGLEQNAQFGPTITFGLGGIFTEVLEDVTVRVLPIGQPDAEEMLHEIKGRKILEGFRGLPPVPEEALVDLLLRAGKMGWDLRERLAAIDMNPVRLLGSKHRVLDAKVLLADVGQPWRESEPNTAYLDRFFDASSVAVVGASATPGKIGNAVLDSLARHEYKGRVHPVNPTAQEIFGLKTHPTLGAVPGPIDLVVAAIPLHAVSDLVWECGKKDVHNLVIVAGGGKELGEGGAQLEETIARLAREAEVRIVGPNCIGVLNGRTRLDTFFQTRERMARPKAGSIAVLTQSGTVGAIVLEKATEIGVSKFVSFGNRLDVDEADLIAYLGEDPETRVIACYIEGLKDGRKFLRAARKVVPKVPIVVFKAGRTPIAARGAVSHTGFFGGTYGPWKGALRQVGAFGVDSIEELFACAKALALQPPAAGNRLAMVTNGAGPMVQGMDLLDSHGLRMADLAPETLARLQEAYPGYFVVQNPLDLTGSASARDYETGLAALLADPGVDLVLGWFVFQDVGLGEEIVEVIPTLAGRYKKPIVCGACGGPYTERLTQALEERGIPVCPSVREWMAAAGALASRARFRSAKR